MKTLQNSLLLSVVLGLGQLSHANEEPLPNPCTTALDILLSGSKSKGLKSIEETLYIGEPIHSKRLSGNNKNEVWAVELKNPKNGKTVNAIVKPRKPGDGGGWNNVTREYTAYYIAQEILGLDYVPPVAYRKNFNLNDAETGTQTYIHEASLAFKIDEPKRLVTVPENEWGVSARALKSDHRILRILLHDPDGHEGNVLFGAYWLSQSGRNAPFFIDFGAAWLPSKTLEKSGLATGKLSMANYSNHTGAFKEPVTVIRRTTYDRLKKLQALDEKEHRKLFKDLVPAFIGKKEIAAFFDEVKIIVGYFEELESKSPGQVIIDE